jgi:putative intracellular protease/amidase/YHS domain-containing protein
MRPPPSLPLRPARTLRAAAALAVLAILAATALCPAARGDQLAAGPEPVLRGLDPVHLTAGEERPGDPRFALDHDGWRYHFASDESRARFEAAPERYAIRGDGQCPVVPAATADPAIFDVHDGKIYIFATEACIEHFRRDPEYYVAAHVEPEPGSAAEMPERRPARKVAILLYEGVELLDFAGPGEVFAAGGDEFEVYTVAASAVPITSLGFVRVTPEHAFAGAPPPDVLVVPGGSVRAVLNDEASIAWIRGAAADAELVLSVCNGALILARAGLLDGARATTHHGSLDTLASMAPGVEVVRDRRWVDNGKVITAAGVSAGIDASLHAVEKLIGPHTASGIARYMEYPWQRDADGRPEAQRAGAR